MWMLLGQLPPNMDETRKNLALWTVFENTGAASLLNIPSIWRDPDAKFVMAKQYSKYLFYLIYHHDSRFLDVYHLIDIDDLLTWGFRLVIENDYVDAMERILADPRIDPVMRNNHPLIYACFDGNVAIVDLLLKDPRIDPTKQAVKLVDIACRERYTALLERLLMDSRIRTASWSFLFSINQSHEYFRDHYISDETQREILQIVDRFL